MEMGLFLVKNQISPLLQKPSEQISAHGAFHNGVLNQVSQ